MNEKTEKTELEKQISSNYEAFQKMKFAAHHRGHFALLRDGELVEVMADKLDAHKLGRRIFKDGLYSIQEINPNYNLGFMSYALR